MERMILAGLVAVSAACAPIPYDDDVPKRGYGSGYEIPEWWHEMQECRDECAADGRLDPASCICRCEQRGRFYNGCTNECVAERPDEKYCEDEI